MSLNKLLWANNRKKFDLKWPDENVVRFLYHNYLGGQNVKILDFGCGSGRNTRVMADLGYYIYAMDYNEECLELTKEKLKNYSQVEYILNEETGCPLEDGAVDCIVAWGALFYLSREREQQLLFELVRVLKKGGLFLADYRSKDDDLYGRGEIIEPDFYRLDTSCGGLAGISYAFRNINEIKELYAKLHMTIINYEKIDHYTNDCRNKKSHYVIWAKKDE